jgi:glycosyltransferase involved in cell wall biosynthesis
MPVFNGANYVAQAIASIRAQSCPDWELIISDNHSTDQTPQICQEQARRDTRIRFVSQPRNLGAADNFNLVFAQARGEFFKWAAHDDLCAPEFLEACLGVLQERPDAVLCHPRTTIIDQTGKIIRQHPHRTLPDNPKVAQRFAEFIRLNYSCYEIFGLIRSETLRQTGLIGKFTSSDRVLLSQLALRGPLLEIPQHLFLRRDHPGDSCHQYPDRLARAAWFSPENRHKTIRPFTTLFLEYLRSIITTHLPWPQKIQCLWALLLHWFRKYFLLIFREFQLTRPKEPLTS